MTKYHRLVLLLTAGLLSYATALEAQQRAGYCAFRVNVRSPAGSPVGKARVAVAEQGGSIWGSAITNEQGVAELCDAPSGLIHITVGDNRCGAVTVSSLTRYWMRTRTVWVTYQDCAGEEWAAPGRCRLTLRVRDEFGSPLAGVILRDSDKTRSPSAQLESDEFGRIFRSVDYSVELKGRMEKSGYLPVEFTDPCRSGEAWDKELTIVMQRWPR